MPFPRRAISRIHVYLKASYPQNSYLSQSELSPEFMPILGRAEANPKGSSMIQYWYRYHACLLIKYYRSVCCRSTCPRGTGGGAGSGWSWVSRQSGSCPVGGQQTWTLKRNMAEEKTNLQTIIKCVLNRLDTLSRDYTSLTFYLFWGVIFRPEGAGQVSVYSVR